MHHEKDIQNSRPNGSVITGAMTRIWPREDERFEKGKKNLGFRVLCHTCASDKESTLKKWWCRKK